MSLKLWLPPALSNPRVRRYVAGHLVSVIGTWFQSIALMWLIYRLSGSAFTLGLAGFALQLPFLIISPLAGVAVDRLPRITLLLAIDAALILLALTLAGLAAWGVTNIWVYLTLALLIGVANAIETPARQSLFTVLVDHRSQLPSMVGISSATFNFGRLIGPSFAGLALIYVPEWVCFLINALSFTAIMAAIISLKLPNEAATARTDISEAKPKSLPDGFRDLINLSAVRYLLPPLAAIGMFGIAYVPLMPSIADRLFGGGSAATGFLMAAAGLGALAASITFTLARTGHVMLRLVRAAPLVLGVGLIALSLARSVWLGALILLVVGFAVMAAAASTNTLIQQSVPEMLRGRAISLYLMAYNGMAPFGHLFTGAVAEFGGLALALALNGAVILGISAVCLRRLSASAVARDDLERAAGVKPKAPD
jgi:MFS family permease